VERSISADPELHSGEWIAVERSLRPRPVNSTWRGDVKLCSANLRVLGVTIESSSKGRYAHHLAELARLLRVRGRILTMGEPLSGEPRGTARIIICLATDYARGEGCVFALWRRLDASRRFRSA
jgi:hypothetical protein